MLIFAFLPLQVSVDQMVLIVTVRNCFTSKQCECLIHKLGLGSFSKQDHLVYWFYIFAYVSSMYYKCCGSHVYVYMHVYMCEPEKYPSLR